MGDFAKDLMKKLAEAAEKDARKQIESKLRPLQFEIREEGARVRLVPGKGKNELFRVTVEGASEELQEKINKALR